MDSASFCSATQILDYFKILIFDGKWVHVILGVLGKNVTEQQKSMKDIKETVQYYEE